MVARAVWRLATSDVTAMTPCPAFKVENLSSSSSSAPSTHGAQKQLVMESPTGLVAAGCRAAQLS